MKRDGAKQGNHSATRSQQAAAGKSTGSKQQAPSAPPRPTNLCRSLAVPRHSLPRAPHLALELEHAVAVGARSRGSSALARLALAAPRFTTRFCPSSRATPLDSGTLPSSPALPHQDERARTEEPRPWAGTPGRRGRPGRCGRNRGRPSTSSGSSRRRWRTSPSR